MGSELPLLFYWALIPGMEVILVSLVCGEGEIRTVYLLRE